MNPQLTSHEVMKLNTAADVLYKAVRAERSRRLHPPRSHAAIRCETRVDTLAEVVVDVLGLVPTPFAVTMAIRNAVDERPELEPTLGLSKDEARAARVADRVEVLESIRCELRVAETFAATRPRRSR